MTRRARIADAVFALAMLAVAGTVWREASRLPPALFDPLGPKSVPMAICALLAALSLVLLVRTLLGLKVGSAATSLILGIGDAPPTEYRLRPGLALGTYLLTGLYILALSLPGIPFLWATVAYLAILGVAMSDRTRKQVTGALLLAAIGGFAVDFIFRRIFVVDLP